MKAPFGMTRKQMILGGTGAAMASGAYIASKVRGDKGDATGYGLSATKATGGFMFGMAMKDSELLDGLMTGHKVQMLKYGKQVKGAFDFRRISSAVRNSASDLSTAKRISSGANRIF